ncbi:MAG: polysaccharide deacetylase family protein [Vicingaceae bacterium]|nr:polysaccharide deacetylase family protein [Vicingaceae bacterium]
MRYLVSQEKLIQLSGNKVIFPYYHFISEKTPLHLVHKHKTLNDFKTDLSYLLSHFQPISLTELLEHKKNNIPFQKNSFHLTFDEGFYNLHSEIAPILKEHEIPATIFVAPSTINNVSLPFEFKKNILSNELYTNTVLDFHPNQESELDELARTFSIDWNNYLSENQPFLTSKKIEELISNGFTIGSLIYNHHEIGSEQLKQQVILESQLVKNQFNLDYSVCAFHYSDKKLNHNFFSFIEKYIDISFGTHGLLNEKTNNHKQRILIDKAQKAEDILKITYSNYWLKKLCFKNTIKR